MQIGKGAFFPFPCYQFMSSAAECSRILTVGAEKTDTMSAQSAFFVVFLLQKAKKRKKNCSGTVDIDFFV